MPKKTNLNPYKSVAVALFIIVVLIADGVAWKQNLVLGDEPIFARIGNVNFRFELPCSYSSNNSNFTTGKHTVNNPRFLSHIVPGTLTYPTTIPYNGQNYNTVAAVNEFWSHHVYSGYDFVSNATPSQNCHGYSTGKGIWFGNFQDLMDDDWTKYSLVADLGGNMVYGGNGHSVKIAGVAGGTSPGTQYQVVVSEKYRDSGVYKRSLFKTVGNTEEVELDLKGALELMFSGAAIISVNIDENTVNEFYTK